MKLTVKRSGTIRKVYRDGKLFVNLYRIAKGFGNGKSIKDGEWVINRTALAIKEGWFFPPVSYPTINAALKDIEAATQPVG